MKKYITLILALIFLNTTYSQKIKLCLNLIKGQTYYQNVVSNSTVSEEINGQPLNIELTVLGRVAYNLTDIKDSLYSIEVRYEKLSMAMKTQNSSTDFDSEKNDDKDIGSILLGALKDRPFYIKMNRLGKVTEVKNIDSIFAHLFDKFPQLSELERSKIQAQLMLAYGEKAFKSSIEMATAIFTDSPIQTGNSWVIKTKLESGMEASIVTTYALKESGEGYNLISGDSKIETADKDAYIQSNGMPMKYNLTGTMTSNIKIDKITGWIIDSKRIQTMSGTVEIKDNSNIPGGMIIPVKMLTEMKITSK